MRIKLGGINGSKAGNYAIVDSDDYEELNRYKWTANKKGHTFYATRNRWLNSPVSMHRCIIECEGFVIDHINRNGLDNRKSNIRACTQGENCRNQRIQAGGYSIYKGVSYKGGIKNPWYAYIKINRERKWLGAYPSEILAAEAYNRAATILFGEFACLNKIEYGKSRIVQLSMLFPPQTAGQDAHRR